MFPEVKKIMDEINKHAPPIEDYERGLFNDTCVEPAMEKDLCNEKRMIEVLNGMDWSDLEPFLDKQDKIK